MWKQVYDRMPHLGVLVSEQQRDRDPEVIHANRALIDMGMIPIFGVHFP